MFQVNELPQGMRYWFWFTICLGRGNSSGFQFAFPTIIAPTTQVREPVCEFWQLLSVSIPISHSGTRETLEDEFQDPLDSQWVGLSWPKFHESHDLHKPLLKLESHNVSWGLMESLSIQNQYHTKSVLKLFGFRMTNCWPYFLNKWGSIQKDLSCIYML